MREHSCCFTGHRPASLPWGSRESDERCLELKYNIAVKLEDICSRGYRHFICGMALGCDLYFAEAVLALRELHSDVTLEAAIPCASQADKWPRAQQERYKALLDNCDKCTVLQQEYSPRCMQRRNEYMVDNSSLVLSCFNGRPSGTMNTLLYAQRQGVETLIIDIE